MVLWIVFAALTAAVLALLAVPLLGRGAQAASRGDYDLAVYRDQLAELERDAAAGRIMASEAENARNEIARRMLAAQQESNAAKSDDSHALQQSKAALMVTIVGLPVLAVPLYLTLGRPDLPAQPWAQRMAAAEKNNDFPALVAKVEAHLAKNPKDARGWLVLAPAYKRMQRFSDAAQAFQRALALGPPSAQLYTDFGEALVLAGNGMVSATARQAFDAAIKLDANFTKARFYRALADRQEGRKAEALAGFQALLKGAPANAPWRTAVERQIASLQPGGSAPQIDADQVQAAQQMTASERQQMIRGMVDRLSARLAEDANDLEGWLRLANARMVLGEKELAEAALDSAAKNFAENAAAIKQIADMRKKLGLAGAQ